MSGVLGTGLPIVRVGATAGHTAQAGSWDRECLVCRAGPGPRDGSARRGPALVAGPACTHPGSPVAAQHRRARRPRGGGAGPDPRWTGPKTPRQTRIRPARSAPSTAGARRRCRPALRSAVTTADGHTSHRPALPLTKIMKSCSTNQNPACPADGTEWASGFSAKARAAGSGARCQCTPAPDPMHAALPLTLPQPSGGLR